MYHKYVLQFFFFYFQPSSYFILITTQKVVWYLLKYFLNNFCKSRFFKFLAAFPFVSAETGTWAAGTFVPMVRKLRGSVSLNTGTRRKLSHQGESTIQ